MEQFVCGSFQPASPLSISLHLITSLSGNLHPAPVSVSFLPVAELARLRAIGHHISIAPCLAQPLNSPQHHRSQKWACWPLASSCSSTSYSGVYFIVETWLTFSFNDILPQNQPMLNPDCFHSQHKLSQRVCLLHCCSVWVLHLATGECRDCSQVSLTVSPPAPESSLLMDPQADIQAKKHPPSLLIPGRCLTALVPSFLFHILPEVLCLARQP